jgi:hypothetical protein
MILALVAVPVVITTIRDRRDRNRGVAVLVHGSVCLLIAAAIASLPGTGLWRDGRLAVKGRQAR